MLFQSAFYINKKSHFYCLYLSEYSYLVFLIGLVFSVSMHCSIFTPFCALIISSVNVSLSITLFSPNGAHYPIVVNYELKITKSSGPLWCFPSGT